MGRPVTVHINVTSQPSSAVRFGEIQMIFGGTENKEKVREYEQTYASKEELKCLKSLNRVSRIIDHGS